MTTPGPFANTHRALWRASEGSIALDRGDTLQLDDACGATVRLHHGDAWVSVASGGVRHVRAGDAIGVRGAGPTLIYALRPVSLSLQDIDQCIVERRPRGEVRG